MRQPGALPTGWTTTSFADLLREPLRNGHSARATGDPSGIPIVTLTAVTLGDFSVTNLKLTNADPNRVLDLWLEPGDLLIQRSNTPELVGTARMFRGRCRWAVFPDLLIRARIHPLLNSNYVERFLQSPVARRYFQAAAQGIAGSMPKISQQTIESMAVPLAPLHEQARIAREIDVQLTRLEAATAALERTRKGLVRYRASVLKAACRGRLFSTDHGGATERCVGQQNPPAGWCLISANELFSFVTSGSRGWARYYTESSSGSLFIRIGNLKRSDLSIDLSEVQRVNPPLGAEGSRTRVSAGDLLISITADLGLVGVVGGEIGEAYINQHICLARPVRSAFPRFLGWFLASPEGQEQIRESRRGATKAGLRLDDIRGLLFAIPPLEEQHRIVAEIERRLSIADEVAATIDDALARAERLRQAILKRAFEGKLVPQDPNDEPASVLLERIRKERESHEALEVRPGARGSRVRAKWTPPDATASVTPSRKHGSRRKRT